MEKQRKPFLDISNIPPNLIYSFKELLRFPIWLYLKQDINSKVYRLVLNPFLFHSFLRVDYLERCLDRYCQPIRFKGQGEIIAKLEKILEKDSDTQV
jgi:hypothetical protein